MQKFTKDPSYININSSLDLHLEKFFSPLHSIYIIIDENKINSTKVLVQNTYCGSHLEMLPMIWSETCLFLFQHQNNNPFFPY